MIRPTDPPNLDEAAQLVLREIDVRLRVHLASLGDKEPPKASDFIRMQLPFDVLSSVLCAAVDDLLRAEGWRFVRNDIGEMIDTALRREQPPVMKSSSNGSTIVYVQPDVPCAEHTFVELDRVAIQGLSRSTSTQTLMVPRICCVCAEYE